MGPVGCTWPAKRCSPNPWHWLVPESVGRRPSLSLHQERGKLRWLLVAARVLLLLSEELPGRRAEGTARGFVEDHRR